MYLIINLGLKSIRGIIFTESGNQIYSKSHPVFTTLFYDKVEQDPKEWKYLLDQILMDIKENTDLSPNIRFISVTTSSSCILGVDNNLKPITKVLMVSDKRAYKEVDQINNSSIFKNVNFACPASSVFPKALWFKNNEINTYNSVRYWIGAGEYLNLFFTGELFTDPLNASKASYENNSYCEELIEEVGLSRKSLPEVVEIGTKFKIKNSLKEKYSFNSDCQFILTTYDAICAVLGSSSGEDYNACDVSGTVTSVRLLFKKTQEIKSKVLLNQYISLLDRSIIGASNNLGGGIIEWHKQAFYKKYKSSTSVYFKMENAAQKAKVGSNGMIFLPYLLGERAPFIEPNASATFFGIKRSSTIKDFTRAVFESTGFVTRDLVELIQNEGKLDVKTITVSGGLARFDLINQIKADVCNKSVYVVENFESTSIGSFILMTISNKVFNSIDEALKKVVRVRKIINPSEENHELYNKYFSLYKELNSNLSNIYKKHKKLQTMRASHENEKVKNL